MNSDIKKFILQSQTKNLKTSSYPKEYSDLDVKFSFGMGTPAKISWVSVHNQEIRSTKGINCVYLLKKSLPFGRLFLIHVLSKFYCLIT